MLGLCCEYGMGIEQKKARAELLYRESCEGGSVGCELLKENGSGGRGSGGDEGGRFVNKVLFTLCGECVSRCC